MSRFALPTVILCLTWSCWSLLVSSLFSLLLTTAAAVEGIEDVAVDDVTSGHVQAMIEWLRSTEDGYFTEKLEIRRSDPTDPKSYFGVFASSDLEEDELLITMPREMFISVESTSAYYEDVCVLKDKLKREMELGEKSDFAKYINYLKTQKPGQLPANYSPQGKKLLAKIVGTSRWLSHDGTYEDGSMLPPNGLLDFRQLDCLETPHDRHMTELVIQRGFDLLLIPVYDMINHKNGLVNVITSTIFDSKGFNVTALRDIKAGEEIFITYDRCDDCEGVEDSWGTPEIFRDFGFVESFPQRWHFLAVDVSFDLEEAEGDDDIVQLTWIYDRPADTMRKLLWLEHQKKRLEKIGSTQLMDAQKMTKTENAIPKHELENIVRFYDEILNAIALAYEAAKELAGLPQHTHAGVKPTTNNKKKSGRRKPPAWAIKN